MLLPAAEPRTLDPSLWDASAQETGTRPAMENGFKVTDLAFPSPKEKARGSLGFPAGSGLGLLPDLSLLSQPVTFSVSPLSQGSLGLAFDSLTLPLYPRALRALRVD